jgi:hypothetical protein
MRLIRMVCYLREWKHLNIMEGGRASGSRGVFQTNPARKDFPMSAKKTMVTAVFRNRFDSERAFEYLRARGYTDGEINVLMSDRTRSTFYPPANEEEKKHEAHTHAKEGMGIGGAIGTAVGATLAAVAAIGTTLAIPLTGGASLIVAGPLVAALAGGGAGAVTGGFLGMLVGGGMTEQNAKAYEEALRHGGVALGVTPHENDDANEILKAFREFNGENVCQC